MAEGAEMKVVKALERIATANEQLIELAKEERDVGGSIMEPIFCPHCGTVNPKITSEGGDGPGNEFVLIAHCQCSKTFIAQPRGWLIFANKQDYEGRTT